MTQLVKRMPYFSVIYLHNPFQCINCERKGYCKDKNFDFYQSNTEEENSSSKLDFSFVRPTEKFKKYLTYESKHIKTFKKYKSKSGKREVPSGKKQILKKKTNVIKPDKAKQNVKKPSKGTLKRRRWVFNKMSEMNNDHEDDFLEGQKFGHFQFLLEDDTDNSEQYETMKTPVFSKCTSPRQSTPPEFQDCFSSSELSIFRKGAEEYHYRRGRRRPAAASSSSKKDQEGERDSDIQRTLETVAKILRETQMNMNKENDSDEDHYFTDN